MGKMDPRVENCPENRLSLSLLCATVEALQPLRPPFLGDVLLRMIQVLSVYILHCKSWQGQVGSRHVLRPLGDFSVSIQKLRLVYLGSLRILSLRLQT